jgi:hypothetical protein
MGSTVVSLTNGMHEQVQESEWSVQDMVRWVGWERGG